MSPSPKPEGQWERYPRYKEPGIAWLDAIPSSWELRRLKSAARIELSNVDKKSVEGEVPIRLCNYNDVYKNETVTAGMDFMSATATMDQVRRLSLRLGDVLITKDSESWTDIAVPAYVAEDLPSVLCGYHLALLRPAQGLLDGRFLARALEAVGPRDQFHVAANGVTRFGLGADAIGSAVLALPPLEEQGVIAAFLDRETAKIDALVAKRLQLVALLEEKVTSLISSVVTRGLDGDPAMQDTRNAFLRRIPAGWQVRPLMHLTDEERPIMYGIVLPGPDFPGGVPIVKGGDVAPGRLARDQLDRTSPEIDRNYARSRLRGGDLVFAIRGSIGAVELVPDELEGANLTQDAARVAARAGVHVAWLRFALRSRSVFAQLEAGAAGAAVRGINIGDLKRARIPTPPLAVQVAMAGWLQQQSERIDTLVALVRESVALLMEHRAALISAAVTGKIDVRGEVDRNDLTSGRV